MTITIEIEYVHDKEEAYQAAEAIIDRVSAVKRNHEKSLRISFTQKSDEQEQPVAADANSRQVGGVH